MSLSLRLERAGYFTLMISSAAASLGKLFVFAIVLGPQDFAFYALLDLIAAYGLYLGSFGLVEGASRLVPLLTGQGKVGRAGAIAARTSGGVLALSSLLFVVLTPLALLLPEDGQLSAALIAAGVFAIANNLFLVGSMLPLARGKPAVFAALMFLKNVVTLVLGAALGSLWGFLGAIISETAVTALLAAWSLWPGRFQPAISFGHPKRLARILKTGVPFMLSALAQNFTRNIDRIAAGATLGLPLFGQYTFAMSLALGGLVVLNILSQYVTPKITHAFGAGAPVRALLRRLDMVVIVLLAGAAALYPVFLLVIDRLGASLFADYAEGLGLMKIIYVGAALQLLQLYQGFLVARGEGWQMMTQFVVIGLLAALACWYAYANGLGAEFFAYVFVGHRLVSGVLIRLMAGGLSSGAANARI